MELVFGFDIGTTSIGFAAVEYDEANERGHILRIGSRIFPEARDTEGTPLNQTRRAKRMMRRQLRRRRTRRRELAGTMADLGMLPPHRSAAWSMLMQTDPVQLRARALTERLELFEVGRALTHLAKRRHFRGRDLEETEDGVAIGSDATPLSPAEIAELGERQQTVAILDASGDTLAQHLAQRGPRERQRGVHALRRHVQREFDLIWEAQSRHHPEMTPDARAAISDIAFLQKPVFWRTGTLGDCALEPHAEPLAKGAWMSAQRRMLEKLNSLRIEGGNGRPLTATERVAVLEKLQQQQSMSFPAIRTALEPLFKAEGLSAKNVKFNLENGGETKLPGNPVEAKLAGVFGAGWAAHPFKQAIRNCVYDRIGGADYGRIGKQRVVIRRTADREAARQEAAASFARDFGATPEQVGQLAALSFPTGWDAFSAVAVERMLPELERGVMMGQLLASPDWAQWRQAMFPNRIAPTGEIFDRLPSPANKDEEARQKRLRNPTVVRTQNELRKVVNNLIDFCGRKPDRIRIELARDIGLGKAEREEKTKGMRQKEKKREAARKDLCDKGFAEPSRDDIEKWLLWQECQHRCPYTGDEIGFDALFHQGRFEVEHIWPRSRSLDDSQGNKTLCRKDVNLAKGNQTPFEFFRTRPEEWAVVKDRLWKTVSVKGKDGMSPGKIRRFLKEELPDDFASRQLNDTGYAARQALEQLKRLWPDVGPAAPVTVQAVNGKVTAHLRRLWELNHLLGDTGEKNRADHRHHAVDALVVALAVPAVTKRLADYWKAKDDPRSAGREKPSIPPPWEGIRADAQRAVDAVVVSHRVRKKVSGPLHLETVYGDSGQDVTTKSGTYREFVRRKKVEMLTRGEYDAIRDPHVRSVMKAWLEEGGGDPKKLDWKVYPRVSPGGAEIKSVRILVRQQVSLMAPVSTGYADLGSNHHIAVYRRPDGKCEFEVVSLFEAARRLANKESIVRRVRAGCTFVMSLAAGDMVQVPLQHQRARWKQDDPIKDGHRVVQGVWASGVVVLVDHRDPKGDSTWLPRGATFPNSGIVKVNVDPIGRIRPAND